MIKVVWFLKRAEHLSLEEFRDWWLNRHAYDVAEWQKDYLLRYKVSVREMDTPEDSLAGKPAQEFEWDGMAEQWFASEESFNACYGRPNSPTRADTLAHTSRLSRIIVREKEFSILGKA